MSQKILTVSLLNKLIKSILESESTFLNLNIVGEVSTLTKHYTGHYYFTLKDDNSQIKCMMFSSYASRLNFDLKNGQQVLISGYLGVYEKGGSYQLYCREIFPYGDGKYLLELAKLKEKLKNEGIFDKEKKEIPLYPKRIGLITAKTGAAIHDFLSTIKKRFKTETYIFPCLVQGDLAPLSIIKAIDESEKYDLDILVITRGGGSKEDLKCFNDEALVRRLYECKIPVITAVGHQVDTTLIDYVSDYSCITPTDAASKCVRSIDEINNSLNRIDKNFDILINKHFEQYQNKIMHLSRTLDAYSPINKLTLMHKHLVSIEEAIDSNIRYKISKLNDNLTKNCTKLLNLEENFLKNRLNYLLLLNEKLNYLNPYNILDNGYSMIKNKKDELITSTKNINIDDELKIRLKDGELTVKVVNIKEN